jgi:citrate lyase subunit beta / citryl-CoA lyase
MRLRSLLFIPADSERKYEKGCGIGADALVLDLEDSVADRQKDVARLLVQSCLASKIATDWKFFVRINPLDAGMTDEDLSAIVRPGLDAIMLPKANSADDLIDLALRLDGMEIANGLAQASVKIVVLATETPKAMFGLNSYIPAHPRLVGLTWGAEDLAAAIGATANRDQSGQWTFPYQVARTQALFAASAAGVAPIDTVYTDFRDPIGLEQDCEIARRDGFTGRLAIHPNQVAIINRAFSPSAEELEFARRVVQLFAENPDAGTIGIDGKMYDVPHLKSAQRVLAAAGYGEADDAVRPGFD